MTKQEEAVVTPGLVLMICSAGRRVSAVEWIAPETMPSAAFFFIIMVPKTGLVLHGGQRLFGGHALGLAQLIESIGIFLKAIGLLGVDDGGAGQILAVGRDLLLIAQQNDVADAFLEQNSSRLHRALFRALRQHDALFVSFRLRLNAIHQRHFTFPPWLC